MSSTPSSTTSWTPSFKTAILCFLSVRLLSSLFNANILSDCDEVMNYWEPTHYLLYGTGLQTWEYSPQYGLRSYAYIGIHALIGRLFGFFLSDKISIFFGIRVVLGIISAFCESFFYESTVKYWGNRVGLFTFLFLLFSPGMFIASTAFLPSAFSMLFLLLAFGFWMRDSLGLAVFCVAGATLLGWPFCVVLTAPLALHALYSLGLFKTIGWGVAALISFVGPSVIVDYYYYHKLIVPPINIILYNVFTPHGADLYGVEPWSFYVINLFLNFNFIFPLAALSLPALWVWFTLTKRNRESVIDGSFKLLPLYIWMAIMLKMAHKEERFLFVVYPLICLCASVTLSSAMEIIPILFRSAGVKINTLNRLVNVLIWSLVFFSFILSVSRIASNAINYSAPLFLWRDVEKFHRNQNRNSNVCVGKEWYRFPSHFFLPEGFNIAFIRDGFGGQLPQLYQAQYKTSGLPPYFNDMNREEQSRYVDLKDCDLLVDLREKGDQKMSLVDEGKEYFVRNGDPNGIRWKESSSYPFLISHQSKSFSRAFYIPLLSHRWNTFGDYCLFVKQ